jgi:uncharacterized protein (DUF305 family)
MDIQEIKKDVKNMHVSKNVIIGILAVALVVVSAVAIGLGVDREDHGDRGEHNRGGMMEQGYDDHNVNPNDRETNDDQATPASENTIMNNTMTGMMSDLQGKTGDAFDKEFLSEMIVHHQGAVEMAKAVLATSKRPELIKLANDIISAQTKEIDMMKGWQTTWFK